jgi:plasmid maintenance system antidote protein VapI
VSTLFEERKTALTPGEKLRVAVAVLLDGFDQHKVAALMGVNPGRVNEAVMAVRKAIDPEWMNEPT